MSIYSKLLDLGYTDADITSAAEQWQKESGPRRFGLVMLDQADGDPVVGVSYMNDYRAEEEWGVTDLRKALHGEDKWNQKQVCGAENHIGRFSGGHSLILTKLAYRDLDAVLPTQVEAGDYGFMQPGYDSWYRSSIASARGLPSAWLPWAWKTVVQLRAIAVAAGVDKPARTKDALIAQIQFTEVPETPDIWPGWFHFGNVLILKAERGIMADVLDLLYRAGRAPKKGGGSLALGSGGFGPFSSGMSLFDSADLGAVYLKERAATEKWTKQQEKALEPVAKELKADGFGYYFLGNPTEQKGAVKYWLNSHGLKQLGGKQAFGWYTLEELRNKAFLKQPS